MAQRYIVTLKFLVVPNQKDLDIITERLRHMTPHGKVPPGAEGAAITLGDYDFPGFDLNPPGLREKSWREPNSIERFQAILHVLGFPNKAKYHLDTEDSYFVPTNFTKSNPKKLSKDELDLVKVLFPEYPVPVPDKPKPPKNLEVTPETWQAIQALKPRLQDVNTVSRTVNCCKCGKELAPQLLNRHWEMFEAEGPAKGQIGIRVSGWSCLSGC
jgi:hypothetical protein